MGRAFLVPGVDFSSQNLGTVTLNGPIPIVGLSISGLSSIVGTTGVYQAVFEPAWTTQKSVTWSIVSGGDYASISNIGVLTIREGASFSPVTIRCTSSSNNNVMAEKTVTVTYSPDGWAQMDWIQNTGHAWIKLDDFEDLCGATVEFRGTITNANGYLFGGRHSWPSVAGTISEYARFAGYRRNDGKVGYLLGNGDFGSTGVTASDSTRYRWKFILSSTTSSADASVTVYDDVNNTQLFTLGSKICYMTGFLSAFVTGKGPHGGEFEGNQNNANGKFYGATVTKNGTIIANYVPGVVNNVPCIKNTISGECFYNGTENNTLTAGND